GRRPERERARIGEDDHAYEEGRAANESEGHRVGRCGLRGIGEDGLRRHLRVLREVPLRPEVRLRSGGGAVPRRAPGRPGGTRLLREQEAIAREDGPV
ncbi:MAG: hypothetical protein AVDCRST_MAG01-01-4245, partial [uncultured Rubrobacteraceae bacterium]